ncbi:septum formation family protein [Corynebacterium diphtheriae]
MGEMSSKKVAGFAGVAALVVASGVGAYTYTASQHDNAAHPQTSTSSAPAASVGSFTSADAGACLTWADNGGKVSKFEQTDCASEHRFEVSSREDLNAYPSKEFSNNAAKPDLTRQAQLREELCLSPTLQYLGGTYDPLGRYSIASILPPQDAWEKGDRTLLCGVQATDDSGKVIITSGKAAEQDQSRIFGAGQCLLIDAAKATRVVDCQQDHQLEITSVVDLQPVFPQVIPSIEDQDNHLQQVCTQAARDYLGGDDPLYYSTLQPFWTTLPDNSWSGGSHSVNCALVLGQEDGNFGVLHGTAKHGFTINGQPPAPRPERAPIVNPEVLEGTAP